MNDAAGYLTTHVLDTAHGRPAAGVPVAVFRLDGIVRTPLAEAVTNADGRTDAPLIQAGELACGEYELVFRVGEYFAKAGLRSAHPFLDTLPIRFGVSDASAHYHVPLLVSPYGFSIYRGS